MTRWLRTAKAPGLDMDAGSCRALVAFVRDLPRPSPATGRRRGRPRGRGSVPGRRLRGSATCRSSGEWRAIYSDLLLHDMGPDTGDTGSYRPFRPDPSAPDYRGHRRGLARCAAPLVGREPAGMAYPSALGVRDSGPYLHDGRADTLEQAIALHGGEGRPTALRYFCALPRRPGGRDRVPEVADRPD